MSDKTSNVLTLSVSLIVSIVAIFSSLWEHRFLTSVAWMLLAVVIVIALVVYLKPPNNSKDDYHEYLDNVYYMEDYLDSDEEDEE